ncbi:RmlC-like cupin domain-containing protein [Mycena alexandri]|uniref:RmlC-like cupin domain-containing protein n=1 Tax=Mycena alexandri TaxID=1745969 RepID=A0AAD6SYC9_9AGAR|nr:RmlC-like cupin domain-containing protein [Mycena alexandri]
MKPSGHPRGKEWIRNSQASGRIERYFIVPMRLARISLSLFLVCPRYKVVDLCDEILWVTEYTRQPSAPSVSLLQITDYSSTVHSFVIPPPLASGMLFNLYVILAVLGGCSLSAHAAPAVATPPPVPLVANAASIASGLKGQPSVNDRLKKLLYDSSGKLLTGSALRDLTVFDFNNQAIASGAKGGSILLATVDNFPILEEFGISGAISFVEPCGLNIPHLHPRADEMLTVYQATIFPKGSIHYQQNPTCSPAVFVASLNSEDPGRSDIATNFWMLPDDILDSALGFPETIGGGNIDAWRAHLPANLAAGVDSCLQACGLSQ